MANKVQKRTRMRYINIVKLKENPDNPRLIRSKNFQKLRESIRLRSDFLRKRPIIVDKDWRILAGNMRFKACESLGWKKVPVEVFRVEDAERMNQETGRDLSYEEYCQEYVLLDNAQFGEDDMDMLANRYEEELLESLNKKLVLRVEEEEKKEGVVPFSEYIGEVNNFVVLVFDNELDWLNARTHFDLGTVYAKRSNGKPWSKGVGRVVDGGKYLSELKK